MTRAASSNVKAARAAAWAVLALFVLPGCRRPPSVPDPRYQEASRLYGQLYAAQLDDAYADPRMDEVVRLLRAVEPASIDAEPARALLGTIERGRAALAKERAERERIAAAAAPGPFVTGVNPEQILAASEPPPDAGGPQDRFGRGASIADLNREYGGCFEPGEPFREQATAVSGTVYRLSRSPECAGKLPAFAGQAVLVVDGRIYRRVSDFAPPPDAAAVARDAGAAPSRRPPRADGGAGEYRQYFPGQPIPGPAEDAGP